MGQEGGGGPGGRQGEGCLYGGGRDVGMKEENLRQIITICLRFSSLSEEGRQYVMYSLAVPCLSLKTPNVQRRSFLRASGAHCDIYFVLKLIYSIKTYTY